MVHQTGSSGQKDATFASYQTAIHRCHSNLDQESSENVSFPVNDDLLENMLVDTVPTKPLTRREVEILKLIVSGRTNKEIAQKLCRAQRTVEYHRSRLMQKFGAHNAADLVKQAIAAGLA